MDYDYDLNHEKYILTHSQAVQTHPNFELRGGIDLFDENRNRFQKKFNKPSFSEIDDVKKNAALDLIRGTLKNKGKSDFLRTFGISPLEKYLIGTL